MQTVLMISSKTYVPTDELLDFDIHVFCDGRRVLTDGDTIFARDVIQKALALRLPMSVMPGRYERSGAHHINKLIGKADVVYVGATGPDDEFANKVIALAKSVSKPIFIAYQNGASHSITYQTEHCQASFA